MPAAALNEVDKAITNAEANQVRVNESIFDDPTSKALADASTTEGHPQDLWNDSNGRGFSANHIPTGPSESASGNGGFRMVDQYSTPAAQSALVVGYDNLSKRMEGLEKAVAALTSFVAKTNGGSFPSDSKGNNGGARDRDAEDDRKANGETNTADSDDDEEVEKAVAGTGMLTSSIPAFLDKLASRSRHYPGSVAPPPSFIGKANANARSIDDRLQDLLDSGVSDQDAIHASSYVAALKQVGSGQIPRDRLYTIRNRCSSSVLSRLDA